MFGIADLPIEGIDIPENATVAPFSVGDGALAGGEGSVRWAEDFWGHARSGNDGIVSFLDLVVHGRIRHRGELRMRPRVIGDFVAVSNDFFDDFREFADALTDHKKGRVNFALAEHFQEARSIGGVWAVIECEGDVGAIDAALGEGDFWSWGGGGWRCWGGGCGRVSEGEIGEEKGKSGD